MSKQNTQRPRKPPIWLGYQHVGIRVDRHLARFLDLLRHDTHCHCDEKRATRFQTETQVGHWASWLMVRGRSQAALAAVLITGQLTTSTAATRPLTVSQYRARAFAACRSAKREFAAAKVPRVYSSGAVAHPSSPSALASATLKALDKATSPGVLDPKLATVLTLTLMYLRSEYGALSRLTPPPQMRRSSEQVLRDERLDMVFFSSMLDRAKMDDVTFTGFVVSLMTQGKNMSSEEHALWTKLGLPICSTWNAG